MGRRYSAVVEETALSTATDLIKIVAPSDAIVQLVSAKVTFDASAADIASIEINRATGGGTTTGVTPEKLESSDTAFGGTVYDLTGDTDTTKSGVSLASENVDVRAGFYWQPSPKGYITIAPSGIVAIRSDQNITSVAARIELTFEEIG